MSSRASSREIVVADIGGTNARFALATVAAGRVTALGAATVMQTAGHAGLDAAWAAFAAIVGRPLPRVAAIAVAGPIEGPVLKLTNSPWVIRPGELAATLGLDAHVLINDFGAVGHAVAAVEREHLRHLCGPDRGLPEAGVIAVVGPGTGLGVAFVHRAGGRVTIVETEGGHIDFAPTDRFEDMLLGRLRARHGRVSVERVVSGAGLAAICETLAAIEGVAVPPGDDRALWAAALAGTEPIAVAARDRFCRVLGGIAGDLALAQGAGAVVIAGGLGLRLADRLAGSGFGERFVAKGRFAGRMAAMPVKLITHPQPGLLGAAAAFAGRLKS